MKRRAGFAFAVFVVCAAALMFAAACDSDGLESKTPKPMSDYLEETTDAFVSALAGAAEDGRIAVSLDGTFGEDTVYTVSFGLSFDPDDPDSSVLAFGLDDGEGGSVSVISAGSDTYADISLRDSAANGKVKYVNIGIFDWLSDGVGASEDPYAAVKAFLIRIGEAAFSGVDVNSDKSEYTFALREDLPARLAETIDEAFSVLSGSGASVIYDLLGIDGEDLPTASGEVTVSLRGGALVRIEAENVTIGGVSPVFGLDVSYGTEVAENLIGKVPSSDSGYRVSKLADMYVEQDLSLLGADGSKSAEYGYYLNINLDVLELALNGYDWSALDDDNFFHFRIEHICSDACGEFCASKTRGARGAVFEIAYSPSDFGTHNIYVNMDARYLLSQDYVDDNADFIASTLSDYVMTALTPEMVEGNSSLTALMLALCGGETVGMSVVEVAASDIAEALGCGEDVFAQFEEAFLTSGFHTVKTLSFETDGGIAMQSSDYDIFKEFVWIIDEYESEIKDYDEITSIFSSQTPPVVSWETETRAQLSDGSVLTNLYNASGSLVHGADADGNYVPMSATEARDTEGLYIGQTYVDADGDVHETKARVLAAEGLNGSEDGVQQVVFTIEAPTMLRGSDFASLFPGIENSFVYKAVGTVRLTEEAEDGFTIVPGGEGQTFKLVTDTREVPAFLLAEVTLRYADGSEKSMTVEGTSDAVLKKNQILSTVYSVTDWGLVNVRFEAAGRTRIHTVRVDAPSGVEFVLNEVPETETGSSFYLSYLTNNVHMYAYYGDERIGVTLTADDFLINGSRLSSDTSEWSTKVINEGSRSTVTVFYRANDYEARISKHGYVSRPFTLSVVPEQQFEVQYGFDGVTSSVECSAGQTASFSARIVNVRHGVSSGVPYEVSVRITDPSGADVTAECLTSLRVGSATASGSSVTVELAEILKDPVPVYINAVFPEAGTYNVQLSLKKEGAWSAVTVVITAVAA